MSEEERPSSGEETRSGKYPFCCDVCGRTLDPDWQLNYVSVFKQPDPLAGSGKTVYEDERWSKGGASVGLCRECAIKQGFGYVFEERREYFSKVGYIVDGERRFFSESDLE